MIKLRYHARLPTYYITMPAHLCAAMEHYVNLSILSNLIYHL